MRSRHRSTPPWRWGCALALVLIATGCARNIPDATPAEIPALEAALATAPDDPEIQTRLGVAYYRDGQYRAALEQLDAAVEGGASGGATYLYRGLANEELESWTAARDSYSEYLRVGQSGELRGEIEERLRLIARRALEERARESLAAEEELTGQPPTPRSVAVFPLRLVTDAPELEPLSVALADMMITDLALSNALTVLERAQVQALVDEMNMTEAGLTEPATGARAGRILRAEHVVQGVATTIGPGGLRLDADLLNTSAGSRTGSASDEETLEELFQMEKTIVFQILDLLGVELTPAERRAIDENRVDNLLAFLAYGRGLQALDQGAYDRASAAFAESLTLAPDFQPAQALAEEAGALNRQAAVEPSGYADRGSAEFSRIGSPPPGDPQRSTLGNIDRGVNPSPNAGQIDLGVLIGGGQGRGDDRDPVQESTGQEGRPSTTRTPIRITIPRPGGAGASALAALLRSVLGGALR